MTFSVSVICDDSDRTFEILSIMAKACNASEVERHESTVEYGDGGFYKDVWVLADFPDYVDATIFEKFSRNIPGCSMSSLGIYGDAVEPTSISDNYVYLVQIEGTNICKIGMSLSLKSRIKALKNACPYTINIVHGIQCVKTPMAEVEKALHIRFNEQRRRGEWFELTDESIEYIKSLKQL